MSFKEKIKNIYEEVKSNPKTQGHICILHNDLFDCFIENEIYGFPGTRYKDPRKKTYWRAISSLFNINENDIIFFYRRKGNNPGAQEFHGVYKIKTIKENPAILYHFDDKEYLPLLEERKYLKFRFLFDQITDNPISIENDLGMGRTKKNNNMAIIKALSEKNPQNDRLWGFRHPSVMNIGAARKKSIAAISNKQTLFLLRLLSNGVEREINEECEDYKKYNFENLPNNCEFLDWKFLNRHLENYALESKEELEFEAELYAYIIHSLINKSSPYNDKILEAFQNVNQELNVPFKKLRENIILECLLSVHLQEEIDILLCDSDEKNFLILFLIYLEFLFFSRLYSQVI